MNWQWFLIKSSHAVRDQVDDVPRALCGKYGAPGTAIYDERPKGKSCETCLRMLADKADATV